MHGSRVNPSQTGFFRVNYSVEDWQRLIPAISALTLPATDRLGIQNDAYALSKAGLLPITQFLDIAAAYEKRDGRLGLERLGQQLAGH